MAAGNGFLTESPDTRYGDANGSFIATEMWAHKFVAPSSGTLEISEIGLYTVQYTSGVYLHLAIFEHDAANNCPDTIVENSDSGAILMPQDTFQKCYAVYGTKPTITGGNTYWIGCCQNSANYYSRFQTGTGPLYVSGATYPTWPTPTAWETHGDLTRDPSLYAVYAEVGGATNVSYMIFDS